MYHSSSIVAILAGLLQMEGQSKLYGNLGYDPWGPAQVA